MTFDNIYILLLWFCTFMLFLY